MFTYKTEDGEVGLIIDAHYLEEDIVCDRCQARIPAWWQFTDDERKTKFYRFVRRHNHTQRKERVS